MSSVSFILSVESIPSKEELASLFDVPNNFIGVDAIMSEIEDQKLFDIHGRIARFVNKVYYDEDRVPYDEEDYNRYVLKEVFDSFCANFIDINEIFKSIIDQSKYFDIVYPKIKSLLGKSKPVYATNTDELFDELYDLDYLEGILPLNEKFNYDEVKLYEEIKTHTKSITEKEIFIIYVEDISLLKINNLSILDNYDKIIYLNV